MGLINFLFYRKKNSSPLASVKCKTEAEREESLEDYICNSETSLLASHKYGESVGRSYQTGKKSAGQEPQEKILSKGYGD